MKNKFRQIIEQALKISLTKEEKNIMRLTLVGHIKSHPAANRVVFRHTVSTQNPWFNMFLGLRPAAIALSFFVLFGGGAVFAAQNSLPGNPLYQLKVHVIEEGRAVFAITPEEKAIWASERMSLRLKEAAILADRGQLKEKILKDIEDNFDTQAEMFTEQSDRLEESGQIREAERLNSDLEAVFSVHAGILKNFAERRDEDSDTTISNSVAEQLLFSVEAQRNNRAFARLHIEDRVSVAEPNVAQQAAEQRLREAEQKIEHVKEMIEEITEDIDEEIIDKAMNQLAAAEAAIAEGKTKLEAGEYSQAFILFGSAHRSVQEARLILETSKELKIDIELDDELQEEEINQEEEPEEISKINSDTRSVIFDGGDDERAGGFTEKY